jgi:branched-chain amino acid transport system substrate-binding protein
MQHRIASITRVGNPVRHLDREVNVRSPATRSAIRLSLATLLALGLTACHQSEAASDDLKIVGVTQIDRNGAEVHAPAGATPADPSGGTAGCQPVSIAAMLPLTGSDAALGVNIQDGVQLAIDEHNQADPGCQVTLKAFDSEGDPQKAIAIAPQIIDDPSIIGLIGPGNSGETKVTGALFDQADLVAATPSATNVTLSHNGWRTFIRGLANDDVQGPSVANYLKNKLGSKKVCVVDDSSDYGLGLAQTVRQTLGPVADSSCNIQVKRGDKDFSAAVTQLKHANPDAIFYGGYYNEAATLVQQLRDGGVTATFVSGDASKDPEFFKQAGQSAKGALLSCPCAPASGDFADRYTEKFGQEPGTYSAEGYDLSTIMLDGIGTGHVTRPALLDFVRHYHGRGVARDYQWTPAGELTNTLVWLYQVQ